MDSIMNTLILGILSLWTIRDLIAASGIIPYDTHKYVWTLFYGKGSENILKRALSGLGYSEKKIKRIIKKCKYTEQDGHNRNATKELISILANHIESFNDPAKYASGSESYYYINTMAAIHDRENDHLSKLTSFFRILLNSKLSKPEDLAFIITPKSGNPILAHSIAINMRIPILLVKGKHEKSRASIQLDERPEDFFHTNIEGSRELMKTYRDRIKNSKTPKLKGIILDCNTSGGSQLVNVANIFNNIIEKLELNIEPLQDAAVFFVADDCNKNTAEAKLSAKKINLHRYFDLDEKYKKALHELYRDRDSDSDYFNYYDYIEEVDKLYLCMFKDGKIKFSKEE